MASLHRALLATSLLLRLLTLIFLVASLAIIATAKIYDPDYGDGVVDPPYVTFQDYYAYRYVLSSGVIGCAYTLLVIPFLAINVARRKMAGGSEGGTMFLIFADLVFSVLIATGAAAGLGLAVEYQRYNEKYLDSDEKKFLHSIDALVQLAVGGHRLHGDHGHDLGLLAHQVAAILLPPPWRWGPAL